MLFAAPGAAGDLLDLLEGALGGAQVSAGQAEIGIDHADQGQHRKMVPLGDNLGPDQHIVAVLGHRIGQLGGGTRPRQEVADHQRGAGTREARRDLLMQALDPGAAGHKSAGGEAFRAQRRDWRAVAAMMADETVREAVLDQPGGAIRALEAVAAGPAQGQGRIAPAIEE